MSINSIVLVIAIASLLCISTNQCHYSCKTCIDQLYTGCATCSNSPSPYKINSNSSTGVCINIMSSNANIFGIFFLIIVTVTCALFPSQQIYYFALLFQTISLLYILQVPWIFSLEYILSGLNYLMIFTRIQFSYKQNDGQLTKESIFKSVTLFKTANLVINLQIIGIINIILFLLMVLIPCFKAIRKRVTAERVLCLPDLILDKVLLGVRTFFLMLIQQTVLIIYFSLSNGINQPVDYIIAIIYFGVLTFFVVNQWINPFLYFRGKFAQLNILISKIIIPIFMVLAPKNQFTIFIFILFFLFLDIIITNKNRLKNGINRLLLYKIIGILAVIGLLINYIVDLAVNSSQTSNIIGYLTLAMLCLFINAYILQIFLEGKELFESTKSKSIDMEGSKVLQDNKDITMISMDNKQINAQQSDFNSNVLNFDKMGPEIDKYKKEQFVDIKYIPRRQRMRQQKLDLKKQQLEFKSAVSSEIKESDKEKPIIRMDDSTLIRIKQKQNFNDSNLSEKPSSKQQNNSPPLPFQGLIQKIKRRKIKETTLQ